MDVLPLLINLWKVLVVVETIQHSKDKRAADCPTNNLKIPHGSHTFKSYGVAVVYHCDDGFWLYGAEKLICTGGVWSNSIPKCIINTCGGVPVRKPLRVKKEYDGSLLKFSCEVMYQVVGPEELTCDGTSWSASPPSCKPFTPATNCDFETAGLCGWTHHDDSDVRWDLNSRGTKTTRTGPQYDHTLGVNGRGHYMYFETSRPTQRGHKAMLVSPLYPKTYSKRCFKFWYHILAEKDVSLLQVFIKPDTRTLDEINAMFSVKENKGNKWISHTLLVPELSEPFQILFVATKGASIRSDIAIDDVSLFSCPGGATTQVSRTPSTISTSTTTTTGPTIQRLTFPAGLKTPQTLQTVGVSQTLSRATDRSTLPADMDVNTSPAVSNPGISTQWPNLTSSAENPKRNVSVTSTELPIIETSALSLQRKTIQTGKEIHVVNVTIFTSEISSKGTQSPTISTTDSDAEEINSTVPSTDGDLKQISNAKTSTTDGDSHATNAVTSATGAGLKATNSTAHYTDRDLNEHWSAKTSATVTNSVSGATHAVTSSAGTDHADSEETVSAVTNTIDSETEKLIKATGGHKYHRAIKGESTDTAYIFIAVGVGLTLLIALAILIYWRKRKHGHRNDFSLQVSNPVYIELNNDESHVKMLDQSEW